MTAVQVQRAFDVVISCHLVQLGGGGGVQRNIIAKLDRYIVLGIHEHSSHFGTFLRSSRSEA